MDVSELRPGMQIRARVVMCEQDVEVVEVDYHPIGDSYVRVRLVQSPAVEKPVIWISARNINAA